MGKVYALLVGINGYPLVSPQLSGCLEDVDRVAALLGDMVPPADLALEVLREGDATRATIMERIRAHLGQAGPGDAAYFHFAGHGTQAGSAAEFRPYFASGLDEGLICWDSSEENGLLVNDKDLAWLIADLAPRGAQITVTLDCCHSGSGTRDIAPPSDLQVRFAGGGGFAARRPDLASYADGYYARLLEQGRPLAIPEGQHILLAACDRLQVAREFRGSGVFTTALLAALRASGTGMSYADLFRQCRAAARETIAEINALAAAMVPATTWRCDPQDPQFEPAAGFDVGSGFLGRSLGDHRPRYFVAPSDTGWRVECGAIHGLPVDAASPVTFNLFRPSAPDVPAGQAVATQVLPQASEIRPDFATGTDTRYMAEITSLPVAPLLVGFRGDPALRAAVAAALAGQAATPLALVDDPAAADYLLAAEEGRLSLRQGDRLLQWVDAARADPAAVLVPALATIARWERLRRLDNPRSSLDRGGIALLLDQDGVALSPDPQGHVTLVQTGDRVTVRFSARNATTRPRLQTVLACFSSDFSIQVKRSEPIPGRSPALPDGGTQILHDGIAFWLAEGEQADDFVFKLIVSTFEPDGFLLDQPGLALGEAVVADRGMAMMNPPPKVLADDWLAQDVTIHLARGPAAA